MTWREVHQWFQAEGARHLVHNEKEGVCRLTSPMGTSIIPVDVCPKNP